jgi:hypothetical protein
MGAGGGLDVRRSARPAGECHRYAGSGLERRWFAGILIVMRKNRTLVLVAAHPDDHAYGLAGPVALHADDPEFRYVCRGSGRRTNGHEPICSAEAISSVALLARAARDSTPPPNP